MAGHDVMLEGRRLVYLAAGEELGPLGCGDEPFGFDSFEDRDFKTHPRLRRVLTTLSRPAPLIYGVLHWSDGSDLAELDTKIRNGSATDEDFSGALLAEPRTIMCQRCEAHLRVLAIDTGRALFSASLADRLRKHRLIHACPVCSSDLGLPIVELLSSEP